jgi:hypothetical protein
LRTAALPSKLQLALWTGLTRAAAWISGVLTLGITLYFQFRPSPYQDAVFFPLIFVFVASIVAHVVVKSLYEKAP